MRSFIISPRYWTMLNFKYQLHTIFGKQDSKGRWEASTSGSAIWLWRNHGPIGKIQNTRHLHYYQPIYVGEEDWGLTKAPTSK